MNDTQNGTGSMLTTFLIGGLVGATVTLLFAPNSGRDTRRKMREKARDARDGVTSMVEEGRDYFDKKKMVIKSAIEAGKEAYRKELEKHQIKE